MSKPTMPMRDRFDRFVNRRAADECWEWKGAKVNGYGVFQVRKHNLARAHRMAFEWANPDMPKGTFVLHSCHNRACVNPSHLRAGTHDDNMNDLRISGRARALSAEEAKRALRLREEEGLSWEALGTQFSVSGEIMKRVVRRAKQGDFGGDNPLKMVRIYTQTTPEMVASMKAMKEQGVSYNEIARRLDIHPRTIRAYCGPSDIPRGRPKRVLQ